MGPHEGRHIGFLLGHDTRRARTPELLTKNRGFLCKFGCVPDVFTTTAKLYPLQHVNSSSIGAGPASELLQAPTVQSYIPDVMNVEHLEGVSTDEAGFNSAFEAISQLQHRHQNSTHDTSVLTPDDSASAPFEIPPEDEARLIEQMRHYARQNENALVANADPFWLLVCLRARKGNVQRAVGLADGYLNWRLELKCDQHTLATSDAVRRIFEQDIFVFAASKSRDGRYVLALRYANLNPKLFAAIDMVRAIAFLNEWMMRTYPSITTHGVVMLEDHTDFTFLKFDRRLLQFMVDAFSKKLPTRMSAIHIVNPPWYVRIMVALFGNFFSEKLQARLRVCGRGNQARFAQCFDKDQTFTFLDMGGTLEWGEEQRNTWIERMIKDCETWHPSG